MKKKIESTLVNFLSSLFLPFSSSTATPSTAAPSLFSSDLLLFLPSPPLLPPPPNPKPHFSHACDRSTFYPPLQQSSSINQISRVIMEFDNVVTMEIHVRLSLWICYIKEKNFFFINGFFPSGKLDQILYFESWGFCLKGTNKETICKNNPLFL